MDEHLKNTEVENAADNSQQELEAYKGQLVRVTADFQNYKKRMEKERSEWAVAAQVSVLKNLLPVIDDLERALAASGAEQADSGLALVHKNVKKALTTVGVEPVDCSGMFDPQYHEALMQVENPDVASGTIVQVYVPGYMFKGSVIRHAQVAVAK